MKKIVNIAVPIAILITTYWNVSNFITAKELDHTMMESLMVGSAALDNLGLPYKDYWGIYPPGIYMLMGVINMVSHGNIVFLKVLHILLTIGSLILFWRIMLKLFDYKYQLYINFLCIIAIFFYNSVGVNSTLISSILMGNLLGLTGLWMLLFSKKVFIRYGVSAALFTWAAMLKDPYELLILLPIITIVITHFRCKLGVKQTLKNFIISVVTIVFILIIHFFYLLHLGITSAYLEVMQFKRESFLSFPPYPNDFGGSISFFQSFFKYTFLWGEVFLPLVLVLLFVLAYRHKKNSKEKFNMQFFIILSYCLLNLITFKIQNRVGNTYTLQVILPIFFLFGYLIVMILKRLKSKYNSLVLCLLIMFIFLPRGVIWHPYLDSKPKGLRTFVVNLVDHNGPELIFLSDTRVQEILKKDNRILDLYGWGTPNFYYNYKVRPFNRFFIVHPNLMGEKQKKEWVISFSKELPKIVKYGRGPGSDLNEEEFESNTIRIRRLLSDCYTKINDEIYILPKGKCSTFSNKLDDYVYKDYITYFK